MKGQYAPVVGLFLEMAKNNKPMTVVGDGLQTRDYTYVKDVVEANMLAMCSDDKQIFGEIFNVGTGINHSVLDLVDMIEGDHVHLPPRLGESRDTLADNKKLINILGWQPKEVIDNWIQKYKMEITI